MHPEHTTRSESRSRRLKYLSGAIVIIGIIALVAVTVVALEEADLGASGSSGSAQIRPMDRMLESLGIRYYRSPDHDPHHPEHLCAHMINLALREQTQDMRPPSESEVDKVREDCINEWIKYRSSRTLEELHAEATCILSATNLDALDGCSSSA